MRTPRYTANHRTAAINNNWGNDMKVGSLIKLLQTYPEDTDVIYSLYSEYTILKAEDIYLIEAGEPREDGWVSEARPDKPSPQYVCFPGN